MEHHVYFWLKEENQSSEDRAAFEQGITELFKISYIKSALWSKPAATTVRPVTDNTWSYALQVSFETLADHDAYQVCEEHDVFVNRFKDMWAKVEVRDLA